jgi:hypothetical protein
MLPHDETLAANSSFSMDTAAEVGWAIPAYKLALVRQ